MFFKKFFLFLERLEESIRKDWHDLKCEWQYDLWKEDADYALKYGLTANCEICNDPIFPGEFVFKGKFNGADGLAHAGYHYTLKDMNEVCCAPFTLGSGHWNGEKLIEKEMKLK